MQTRHASALLSNVDIALAAPGPHKMSAMELQQEVTLAGAAIADPAASVRAAIAAEEQGRGGEGAESEGGLRVDCTQDC